MHVFTAKILCALKMPLMCDDGFYSKYVHWPFLVATVK